MAKYDDASWHYGGDYPQDLPVENAAIHIGMFLTWCVENDLLSDEMKEDCDADVEKIKNHEMTGGEFLIKDCDEKFTDCDLNELGNEFAADYYNDDAKFGKNYGEDFCEIFDKYETVYHVEDTWENYELVKKMIDKRFEEWKELKNRR